MVVIGQTIKQRRGEGKRLRRSRVWYYVRPRWNSMLICCGRGLWSVLERLDPPLGKQLRGLANVVEVTAGGC